LAGGRHKKAAGDGLRHSALLTQPPQERAAKVAGESTMRPIAAWQHGGTL